VTQLDEGFRGGCSHKQEARFDPGGLIIRDCPNALLSQADLYPSITWAIR
jgi:hypothetical protein